MCSQLLFLLSASSAKAFRHELWKSMSIKQQKWKSHEMRIDDILSKPMQTLETRGNQWACHQNYEDRCRLNEQKFTKANKHIIKQPCPNPRSLTDIFDIPWRPDENRWAFFKIFEARETLWKFMQNHAHQWEFVWKSMQNHENRWNLIEFKDEEWI